MDELSIADHSSDSSSGNSSVFLLQQVAVEREKLLKGKDWAKVAEQQLRDVFTMTDRTDRDLMRMVSLYTDSIAGDDDVVPPPATS
jgi:HPt (histidine-containing phosphotransfer) domain-containing protein